MSGFEVLKIRIFALNNQLNLSTSYLLTFLPSYLLIFCIKGYCTKERGGFTEVNSDFEDEQIGGLKICIAAAYCTPSQFDYSFMLPWSYCSLPIGVISDYSFFSFNCWLSRMVSGSRGKREQANGNNPLL